MATRPTQAEIEQAAAQAYDFVDAGSATVTPEVTRATRTLLEATMHEYNDLSTRT